VFEIYTYFYVEVRIFAIYGPGNRKFRQKSFSPKQMPWEPSKLKDLNELLLEG
jgi:hypothetical protein